MSVSHIIDRESLLRIKNFSTKYKKTLIIKVVCMCSSQKSKHDWPMNMRSLALERNTTMLALNTCKIRESPSMIISVN